MLYHTVLVNWETLLYNNRVFDWYKNTHFLIHFWNYPQIKWLKSKYAYFFQSTQFLCYHAKSIKAKIYMLYACLCYFTLRQNYWTNYAVIWNRNNEISTGISKNGNARGLSWEEHLICVILSQKGSPHTGHPPQLLTLPREARSCHKGRWSTRHLFVTIGWHLRLVAATFLTHYIAQYYNGLWRIRFNWVNLASVDLCFVRATRIEQWRYVPCGDYRRTASPYEMYENHKQYASGGVLWL